MNSETELELWNELAFYTLAHRDGRFIHQHAVDAFAVQNASDNTKPIAVAFGLIGLYLHLERGYTGREVQRAHMKLANRRKRWPRFVLPDARGEIRVGDVVAAAPGPERDAAIDRWCKAVWQACAPIHQQVRELIEAELF